MEYCEGEELPESYGASPLPRGKYVDQKNFHSQHGSNFFTDAMFALRHYDSEPVPMTRMRCQGGYTRSVADRLMDPRTDAKLSKGIAAHQATQQRRGVSH